MRGAAAAAAHRLRKRCPTPAARAGVGEQECPLDRCRGSITLVAASPAAPTVRAAPSLSECAPINVASRSIVTCSGAPTSSHARARARCAASRGPRGSLAIRSITRNAVASEATDPTNASWSRTARRSAKQSSAVAQHHRQIANHPAQVMATAPLPQLAQPQRQRPRQVALISNLRSNALPACDTSPSPSDATSTVKWRHRAAPSR
jgi:hypothetical protein